MTMEACNTILLVEDDLDDVFFFRDALHSLYPGIDVKEIRNGEDAFRYLLDCKELHTLPDLVVIDINMPVLNGKELVERMVQDAELKLLPKVFFSSSESPTDLAMARHYGTTLINKPFRIEDFPAALEAILSNCT
jgi:DNA-binding response OmpR family regulator